MLGRPARLDYADWFGARTGVSAGGVVDLGGGRREGGAKGRPAPVHDGRHSRTEVVACGSSELATDEGADSGAVRAWGDGRKAAELRG